MGADGSPIPHHIAGEAEASLQRENSEPDTQRSSKPGPLERVPTALGPRVPAEKPELTTPTPAFKLPDTHSVSQGTGFGDFHPMKSYSKNQPRVQ